MFAVQKHESKLPDQFLEAPAVVQGLLQPRMEGRGDQAHGEITAGEGRK